MWSMARSPLVSPIKRSTFARTVGGIAGLTALGVGVTSGHSPGEADDDNEISENGCHTSGKDNKDHADEGDDRDNNPECEGADSE